MIWTVSKLTAVVVVTAILGCASQTGSGNGASGGIAAVPSTVGRLSLRIAQASDLRPILVTRVDPVNHFPICILKLYNTATEPVIVGYTPDCVLVHCGAFEAHGPAVTFVHRREILEPQQALELEIPSGGWTMADADGERLLMIPTTLPAGAYDSWATFKLEGAAPTDLATRHDLYVPR